MAFVYRHWLQIVLATYLELSLQCFDTVGWATATAYVWPVTKLGVGLLVMTFYWIFASLTAPVVTTTSNILSSNIIQNGDIPVPANPGPPGKWSLKWRDTYLEKQQKDLPSVSPILRRMSRNRCRTEVTWSLFCAILA